ncbi:MAG: hypothetical protein K0S81_2122, partial [Rhodospirillales bacterium]|nr:hypothetical protein [Rhodospirillales bacterium]
PKAFAELWKLAEAVARETGGDPRYVFDACGLLLERRPSPWTYFCSPRNALTWASTGGDGVHFGLLQLDEVAPERAPIVMTVPLSDARNVVVAEGFAEFLGLGYHVGWFSLEQLAYDPAWTAEYFAKAEREPDCEAVLKRIRSSLRLKPVPLNLDRILQLKNKYLSLVQLPDEA